MTALKGADPQGANPQGVELARRLVTIHGHMRHGLDQVRHLMAEAADGDGATEAVSAALRLRRSWVLRRQCTNFCSLVQGHHTIEDAAIFPALRRIQPELAAVIDRLESEHHELVDHLDALEPALAALPGDDAARAAASAAIDRLTRHLDDHLRYEEAHLIPAMTRLTFADVH
ncbi:hemerythrin domain-containing protein [Streptosporangium sp. NBC_01639]|uniref:hemerythrin domain-containing protein n=1 Tax=Streptosporangium sp. NBC_01639 TaxID=2975948 RepID=UPI003868C533|nr:hemerythrin domain-containing protein [Streptosporangium sp. NBC_01639]